MEKSRKFYFIGWLWLLACFMLAICYFNQYIDGFLDSDMSSEMLLGNLMAHEGDIMFTSNWWYATDVRGLSGQIILANLFRFSNDWHFIRISCMGILYLILVLSTYFLFIQLKLKKYFPWLAGCILLPFNMEYYHYVLRDMFYIPYIAITFVLLALILKVIQEKDEYAVRKWIGLTCLLSLMSCLNGLRQFVLLFVPLCITAVWLYIDYKAVKKARFIAGLKHIDWKHVPKAENVIERFVFVSFSAFVFAGLGCLINTCILKNWLHLHTFSFHLTVAVSRIPTVVEGWLTCLGAVPLNSNLMASFFGDVLAIFLLMAILTLAVWTIKKNRRITFEAAIIIRLHVIAVAVLSLVYFLTTMQYRVRYGLPVSMLVFPIFAIALDYDIFSRFIRLGQRKINSILMCIFCACALLTGINNYYNELPKIYEGQYQIEATQFLTENGYKNGYGNTENSLCLTELSNGEIEMWTFWDSVKSLNDLSGWLQPEKHFTSFPTGKVFFILSADEKGNREGKYPLYEKLEENHLIFKNDKYYIYGYNSMEDLPKEMQPDRSRTRAIAFEKVIKEVAIP